VPAKDRLRSDEERCPALSGYESGQEADEGTVGPGEAGTGDLATKHGELMAKHQYLGILGGRIRMAKHQYLGILGGRIHATDAKYLKDSSDE
jgi:hypothetical protein